MTEKTRKKLEDLISKFPDEYKNFFREIFDYLVSLGYNPKFSANLGSAEFSKSKHGRSIMKVYPPYNPDGMPHLRLRFDGLPVCTGLFEEAVEIMRSNCERCNHYDRCNGANAIKYTMSNGSEVLGSCQPIRDIPKYSVDELPLIKDALKIQDIYLMGLYAT